MAAAQEDLQVVYLVQGSRGQYEDYRTWIAGVFLFLVDARAFMERATAQVGELCKEHRLIDESEDLSWAERRREQWNIRAKAVDPFFDPGRYDADGVEYSICWMPIGGANTQIRLEVRARDEGYRQTEPHAPWTNHKGVQFASVAQIAEHEKWAWPPEEVVPPVPDEPRPPEWGTL